LFHRGSAVLLFQLLDGTTHRPAPPDTPQAPCLELLFPAHLPLLLPVAAFHLQGPPHSSFGGDSICTPNQPSFKPLRPCLREGRAHSTAIFCHFLSVVIRGPTGMGVCVSWLRRTLHLSTMAVWRGANHPALPTCWSRLRKRHAFRLVTTSRPFL